MSIGIINTRCDEKLSAKQTGEIGYLSITDFRETGLTVADWARSKKFSVRLVYVVLRGGRKCLRGQSYQIAKELGMN